jgi:hypothetical protein
MVTLNKFVERFTKRLFGLLRGSASYNFENNSGTLDNLLVLRCKLNQIFFKHKKECVGCEELFDIVIKPDLVGQSCNLLS